MKICTRTGDIINTTSAMPDGQQHLKIEMHDLEFEEVTIEESIGSVSALFNIQLAVDVLRRLGYQKINLDIRYLLGARMDRPISAYEPFTLDVIAKQINALGFSRVRIFDPHSDVALRLIANSVAVRPTKFIRTLMRTLNPLIVAPDKGAEERTREMCGIVDIQGKKHRDMATGKLSGFTVETLTQNYERNPYRPILIVDDICDGGATFIGLAEKLQEKYPLNTGLLLCVTHGIFSKGTEDLLKVFTSIYTTDSYFDPRWVDDYKVVLFPVNMQEMR